MNDRERRLEMAVKLILSISNQGSFSLPEFMPEFVRLAPKTREQLENALCYDVLHYWVGKTGETTKRFDTLVEAEEEIARLEAIDPEGVHRGDYFLDGPGEE